MLTSLGKLYEDYKSCRARTGTSLNNVSKKASGWKYHYYQDVQKGDGVTCILIVDYGNESKLIEGMKELGLVGKKTKKPFISMKKNLRRWVGVELGSGCLNSLVTLDINLSKYCFVLSHPQLTDAGYDRIRKKRPLQDSNDCTGSNKRILIGRRISSVTKIFDNLSESALVLDKPIPSDIKKPIKSLECSDKDSGLHYIYNWDVDTGGDLSITGSDRTLDSLLRGLNRVADLYSTNGVISNIQGTISRKGYSTSYNSNTLKIYENTKKPAHFRCHPLLCGKTLLDTSQALGNVDATETGRVERFASVNGASAFFPPRVKPTNQHHGDRYTTSLPCSGSSANRSGVAMSQLITSVIPPAGSGEPYSGVSHSADSLKDSVDNIFTAITVNTGSCLGNVPQPNREISPANIGDGDNNNNVGSASFPSVNSVSSCASSASGCGEASHAVCRNEGGYNKFGNLGDGHVLQHSGEISPTNIGDGNDNKIDTASSLICIKPVPHPADFEKSSTAGLERSSSSSGVGVIRDPIIPSIDPWQQGSSAGSPSGNNSAVSSDSAGLPLADSNLKSEVIQQPQYESHEDPSLKHFLSMFTHKDAEIISGGQKRVGQNSLFECTPSDLNHSNTF